MYFFFSLRDTVYFYNKSLFTGKIEKWTKFTNVTRDKKETTKNIICLGGFESKILYNQNFIIKYLFVTVLHIYMCPKCTECNFFLSPDATATF